MISLGSKKVSAAPGGEKPEHGGRIIERYDYGGYRMTLRDKLLAFLAGALAAGIVIHVFFGNVIVDIIAAVCAGIAAQPICKNMMTERIKNKLRIQFKDMLDSVNASISAGEVAPCAFLSAEKDMQMQYGEDSFIYKELKLINIGVSNGETLESLLTDFGERSTIEDIKSFANVFTIANRRGGNMRTILGETKSILCDKIEIEQDIRTMVGSTKNQLNIMMLMPLIIVPMISGLTESGSGNASAVIIKVVALIAFIVSYIIGRKITNIKV